VVKKDMRMTMMMIGTTTMSSRGLYTKEIEFFNRIKIRDTILPNNDFLLGRITNNLNL